MTILPCRFILYISSYFFLNPIPTRLGVGKSTLLIMRNRILKKKHKRPYYKYFYVIQFILAAFQIREMSMRLQNMEQTEIKGNFENFTYMS